MKLSSLLFLPFFFWYYFTFCLARKHNQRKCIDYGDRAMFNDMKKKLALLKNIGWCWLTMARPLGRLGCWVGVLWGGQIRAAWASPIGSQTPMMEPFTCFNISSFPIRHVIRNQRRIKSIFIHQKLNCLIMLKSIRENMTIRTLESPSCCLIMRWKHAPCEHFTSLPFKV